MHGCPCTWIVPVAWSSSVATASTSWSPRSMPVYHIQLNKTDLRSPAAAAFGVGGGVVRCAHASCAPANAMKMITAANIASSVENSPLDSGGEFLCSSTILVSDLRDHVFKVDIAARIALANVRFGIRIQPQYSRTHHPGLQQHAGIIHRSLIVKGVSFAPQ